MHTFLRWLRSQRFIEQYGYAARPMTHVLVSAGTQSAAQAGLVAAQAGGNAIDALVAAVAASWVCEPGMTALGSAAIAVVGPAGERPILIDGLTAMPGLGGHVGDPPGGQRITMPYGLGVQTGIGPGSVAVPGGLAALDVMHREWGALSWADVMSPAVKLARDGFPYPRVSATYLPISGKIIYDLTEGSRAIWRRPDGTPFRIGDTTQLPDLAADLERIAIEGADVFYAGPLGEKIGQWIVEHGGACGPQDFAAYRASQREPIHCNEDGWDISTSDTIGGAALVEMLGGFSAVPLQSHDESAQLVSVMDAALSRRDDTLRRSSSSTTQICVVDEHGNACSMTTSTGYGSGVVVPGTGIMLNNMLGELELLPDGPGVLKPGERLPTNMTPMIATKEGSVVALGAAGADRIAPSMAQTWRGIATRKEPAAVAINSPRFHVRTTDDGPVLDYEPGFNPAGVDMPCNQFEAPHMYFGGVQAAMRTSDRMLDGGGDPRRGGIFLSTDP